MIGISIHEEKIYFVNAQIKARQVIITQAESALLSQLQAVSEINNLKKSSVAIALPSEQLIEQTITLPYSLSKKEIAHFLNFNMEQLINIPAKNLYYDFQFQDELSPNTTIQLYATRKETIISYQKLLAKNFWEIHIIEPDFLALQRFNRLANKITFHVEIENFSNLSPFATCCGLFLRGFDG